ncbi:MAG: hypothetical protein IPO92_01005 [Saprospiraceae bacterium]|nr:hypothetical protein [Saprospiraceae bacterium]
MVNEDNNLKVSCSCNKTFDDTLCEHASIAIAYLAFQFQPDQFISFLNRDTEKNIILGEYGLKLADPESKIFEFGIDYYGKLALKKIPDNFIGLKDIDGFKSKIRADSNKEIKKQKVFIDACDEKDIGLVFMFSHNKIENNPIKIEAFKNDLNKKGTPKITRLLLSNEENLNIFSNLSEERFNALMDFSFIKFKDIISLDSFYGTNFNNFQQKYNEKTRKSYINYFFTKLYEHWEILSNWDDIKILPEGETFHQSNLINVSLCPNKLSLDIKISHNDRFIILELLYFCNGDSIDIADKDINIYCGKIIKIDQTLYLHGNESFIPLLETMSTGKLFFPFAHKKIVMKNVLLPLVMKYDILLPEDLDIAIKEIDMTPAVHFREFQDKYLIIEPKFYYEGRIFDNINTDEIFIEENDKTFFLKRDVEHENELVNYIKSLHPGFKSQSFSPYFQLPFDEVMKNHWFVSASKQMMDKGIKLVGVKELTKIKYSAAIPKWNMSISSGIDWFDINVSANWGDEKIGFRDIKKAILNGQSFVVLGDGSFGVIPEEWIKKYSFLLKIAKDDLTGNLQISKKHFGIIDLLFDQIDDETVLAEIEDKKTKLLNIGKIETSIIPKEITATLRPYQESGYQWMQVLDDISWGMFG